MPQDHGAAKAYIEHILTIYGLESLTSQAWGWITEGLSEIEIVQRVRETDAYAERFPAMQQRRDAGLPAISEQDYISYERQVRQVMHRAGMPRSFLDDPDMVTSFIARDISVAEVASRIQDGYLRVTSLPDSVRNAFRDMFGAHGDQALAAYFLDPDRALPVLEREVRMAAIGGASHEFGIDVGIPRIETLARRGVDFEDAIAGFSRIRELSHLFQERITERRDMQMGVEGVEGIFGLDPQAGADIRRRMEERIASMAGGGGAAMGQQGVFGMGTARR